MKKPEGKPRTFYLPDGTQVNVGGVKTRVPVPAATPPEETGAPASPFLQTDQQVGERKNYVMRDGKLVPLDEATPEEQADFGEIFRS